MFKSYYKEHAALINFTGVIGGLGALFLNVSPPSIEAAKSALVNIQVFWLIMLIVCLTILFFSFVKSIFTKEKEIWNAQKTPVTGFFSVTAAIVFFWIILNLIEYTINFDPTRSAFFVSMLTMSGCLLCFAYLTVYIDKNPSKFTLVSIITIMSFSIAILVSIVGILVQAKVSGYFWLFWIWPLLPAVFLASLIILSIIALSMKKSLCAPSGFFEY